MYNRKDWSGSIQDFSSALFSGLYCFKVVVEEVWIQLIYHPSYCIVIALAIVLCLVIATENKGRESLRLD